MPDLPSFSSAANPSLLTLSMSKTLIVDVRAASRVLLVDGEYLSWYGSRTPDGIAYAATVIDEARSLVYG